MHLLETATGILSANKDVLFHKYPIKELGIFGSVARNEENADSDIYILVSKKAVRANLMPFVLKDIVYV